MERYKIVYYLVLLFIFNSCIFSAFDDEKLIKINPRNSTIEIIDDGYIEFILISCPNDTLSKVKLVYEKEDKVKYINYKDSMYKHGFDLDSLFNLCDEYIMDIYVLYGEVSLPYSLYFDKKHLQNNNDTLINYIKM